MSYPYTGNVSYTGECLSAQNDNIYIKTSIINNSFEDGAIPAEYKDERGSNIIDDACSYEVNILRVVIPRGNIPIKTIDPLLTVGTNIWNVMPEALRITVDTKTEEQNLIWVSELKEEYFDSTFIPNGNVNITQQIVDDKSSFIKYEEYFSLYSLRHFCKIINKAFLDAHNAIKGDLDTSENKDVSPIVSCDNNIMRLHLPESYITSNTPSKIPVIEFNNRLQLLFGKTLPFKYGRLRGNNPNVKWNEINTSPANNEWTTNYDTTSFIAPYFQCIYTYNIGGKSQLSQFKTFGGFNRIEIYSNIPLVKKEYTQKQDTKTGSILSINSSQENLLFIIYLNYNRSLDEDIRVESNFPNWKSISNSGALNEISYRMFLVDNLGNKSPLFLQFGNQINLDLQLRKVF